MALRVHLPAQPVAPDDWTDANRQQLARVVTRAVERAVAQALGQDWAVEIIPPGSLPATGEAVAGARPAPRERWEPARHDLADGSLQVPSFGHGGKPVPVTDVTFEPEHLTVARPDPDVILTSSGDRIMRRPFATVVVIGGGGESYIEAGGSPYVIAANLARAWAWGRLLFGGQGYAILEDRNRSAHAPFFVVPLLDVLSVEDLGGLGRHERLEGVELAPIRTSARLWPLADFDTVTVVTREGIRIASNVPGDRWSSVTLEKAINRVPAKERYVARTEALQVANTLLLARETGKDDEDVLDLIVQMDRTIFAAMPWEQRVRYLVLLIDAWTGEREEIAILELFHATRTASELEAIAAELRARDRYAQLFDDLDGRVFSLLQFFGEFRPALPLDWRYLLTLVEELGLIPGKELSLDELELIAGGFADWVLGAVEGITSLITHPRQALEGLGHLAELLWTIEKARWGDAEAQAFLSQMVRQAAASGEKALRGLAYADELGASFGKRGGSAKISGEIAGRLKYLILFEILSWFIGIGEIKAAVGATRLSERVAAIARALRALRFAGRAGEAAAEASRLERILSAVASAARVTDRVQVLRLAELLPEDLLLALSRMAEAADLPADATIAQLRRALTADKALLGKVDEVVDALVVVERFEAKAGVGSITADMTKGLHRLLREAPWARKSAASLIDQVPAAHLPEFMRTLDFVHPGHFMRWKVDDFAALAQHPRWMAFVREAGSPLLESALARTGLDASRFERLLDGLALKREAIGDPAAYRRLLDRLERGEEAAFLELLGASGTARLRGARPNLLADLDLVQEAAARDRYAAQLAELTDRELDGLEHIAREYRTGAATQHWPSDVLELPAAARRNLLDLMNDIAPHTTEGLDLALRRFFEGGDKDIQGALGQLAAARTLLRRGVGNRVSFEVSQVSREIDIVVEGAGRRIHVEVKTNLAGARRPRPSFDRDEILTDLVTHAASGYEDLIYLYHPSVAGQLERHGQRMLRLFGDAKRAADPELVRRFQAWGLDINKARTDFARWLDPASGHLMAYEL